jgi:hypothetical protein
MHRSAAKEDPLRTLGIRVFRIPNGLVMEDSEDFERRVRKAMVAE